MSFGVVQMIRFWRDGDANDARFFKLVMQVMQMFFEKRTN